MVAPNTRRRTATGTENRKTDRRVDEALERLESGVSRILDGEEFKRYLSVAAHFHHYSPNNCLLILMQRPDATRVAGYRKWQELGRQVRKGEKGIKILAPISRRVKSEADEDTDSLIHLRMAVTPLAGNTHPWHSSNSQRNRRGARSGGRMK